MTHWDETTPIEYGGRGQLLMVTTREPTSQQASWSLHCRTIMSSPLPRLGKTRRAPLLGHSYASFPLRREEDRTSWSPTRLPPVDLSKQTHDRIIREINREHKSIPDDNSLLSSMAARLAMVERELLAAKREIIEKVCAQYLDRDMIQLWVGIIALYKTKPFFIHRKIKYKA